MINKKKIYLTLIIIIISITLIIPNFSNYFKNENTFKINNITLNKDLLNLIIKDEIKKIKIYIKNNNIKNNYSNKQLYNIILNKIIKKILLENYINNLNIIINDDQIKNFISNNKDFYKVKSFNNKKYSNLLKKGKITNNEYINLIKLSLKNNEFLNSVINTEIFIPKIINSINKYISEERNYKISYINTDKLINYYFIKNNKDTANIKLVKYYLKLPITKKNNLSINILNNLIKNKFINKNINLIKYPGISWSKMKKSNIKNVDNISKNIFKIKNKIKNKIIYKIIKEKNKIILLALIKINFNKNLNTKKFIKEVYKQNLLESLNESLKKESIIQN